MKKKINRAKRYKIITIIFYSIIYTIGIQWFMSSANLLTTGMAGVAQIVVILTKLKYGLVYIVLNIPGIYIGFKYIGKKFTYYSLLNILIVSGVSMILPVMDLTDDMMVNAIFGGILMGISMGKILKVGGSCGGTDFFIMYLLKYKNKDFQKVNLNVNMGILIVGIIVLSVTMGYTTGVYLGLYTIISLYIRNSALDQVFTNTNTVTLFIVSENLKSVSKYINMVLHRGTTIINDVEGGFTKDKKQMMMVNLNQYEYTLFIDEVSNYDEKIFINVLDSKEIVGNYKIDKGA